ncbi:MAG: DEAD/DEAH box helicase family protein [Oribacterium sp.]|nr:DEAD/DEAH box helicase family protein [Oribacterium sp.]
MGNMIAAEASVKHEKPAAFSLSDNQINEILRTGGGMEDSRKRIYAKYQEHKSPAEMAEFLKAEYRTTGKGFTFGEDPVSVWFDENGMKAGFGTSAKENTVLEMSWAEIESHIRGMVEDGTYMNRNEAFLVDQTERQRVANHIYFFFRDGLDEMPESLGIAGNNFPDGEAHLMDMLATSEGRNAIATELSKAKDALDRGETELRWRYIKSPEYLLDEVADLDTEKMEFPLPDTVDIKQESFITQDEIDSILTGGSGVSGGKLRIYEYFQQGHDSKDNIAFLKNEYGTGGRSHALIGNDQSWEDHDAKGIKLSKGSIMEPYATAILKWNIVEKRIGELVAADQFLNQAEKEELESRHLEEAAEELSDEENPFEQIENESPEIEEDIQTEDRELTAEETPDDDLTIAPETDVESAEQAPEIDKTGAENFHITDDRLGAGGPKEKFRRNIEAIQTLQKIEGENRVATQEEQQILSQYVGWGGLADAFDENKGNWADEYTQLKGLLTDEEYRAARESTLNAHYTSPVIIRSIYEALGNMGFEKGNVLEPAMGVGNFFGMLPEKMQDSRLYGVELDDITGRIAKQLYPKADVRISGFEKTDFQNDFFDVAVGNVPFGNYQVPDRAYDKLGFQIHDYFFAKTLDKVRPGGIVAFVTSKGTMDKQSPQVRKYLAQRAELVGAVRLPNTAFKENAGTEVTSDILFFKKRDRLMDIEPDWVHLSTDQNGIAMNQYFVDHPEMIVGKMAEVSGPFGMETACVPDETRPFEEQLKDAISHINATYETVELEEGEELAFDTIPADPNVKNYSYCVVDDKVYYRENSIMKPADVSESMEERIKGMIGIRDCTQELITMQMEEYSDAAITAKQQELNDRYDDFSKKFGLISTQTNKRAFNQDSSYCLLCSLEKLDDEGKFEGKADMFTKRTIKRAEVVESVDTASEALAVSLSEKAKVDLPYMAQLAGKSEDEITEELAGVIFKNPLTDRWETADEYLSGNVREKLAVAKNYAENHPEFAVNVASLERVQPKELDASEIEVRIGATWIDPHYIEDFMRETFQTPDYLFNRDVVGVQFSDITGQWNVKGKNADYGNTLVHNTFGTGRANAYKILEDSLNLKDTRIYDTVVEDGKEKRVLNKKETTLASQKQEAIREAFKDWVFRDPERRAALTAKYNELFNSTRPREYDGSHLKFPGMTPDIVLKPHQLNAVAHVLYGDNTLLAHCVGAGKTFEMTAAAMESKRLGLCHKSLFVVPNHLTEQWASDFLRLYPGANILAATKKDFEPANRKKFCSRIVTGDYDAVIIGHSQFEKIPLSTERQIAIIERQIDEIEAAIALAKAERGERYTIKEMEKSRKSLIAKLDKLNDTTRKDNVVTFEQLGVDRLFVDESHNYKNLFLYTKMRNVAGIAQTEAQKSQDMFNKCQYLDEITGGKGVTFATGTPISNSMTELYTNMRYLQYGTLQKMGLGQFDSWAATFGETQTAIELAPEGTGYRAKTRFAKFFNLPELIALFKESADIQTPDMLKLPVPEAEYENVTLKPSEAQKQMVESLAERAERVRNRMVDSSVDNMLKITNDGRKLALDQRLMNDMLPDDPNSKASVCVEKAFEIWEKTTDKKSAQLIFCDLSTPKGDGTFNVYEDIRNKLVAKGVPPEEIAFIHDANTELRKAELFAKVRSGQVRFLLGSTAKMGAGTNVQDKLIALHHLDVPWRPSDIEQQEGRILRQGNTNPKVKIFRYVTEGTFDAYSWQLIENKQKFIGQIMTSKSPVRSCEDIDDAALTYAEVKALATGNPYIKEKMDLDIQVSKLKLMKANHTSQKYRLEDDIAQRYPKQISALKEKIEGLKADIADYNARKPVDKDLFAMNVAGKTYEDRKEAGSALIAVCKEMKAANTPVSVGEYLGMKMAVTFDSFFKKFTLTLKGNISHNVEIGSDPSGNITRINNALESMTKQLEEAVAKLENVEHQLETAKVEVVKPFAQEAELAEKLDRLAELNALLNMDEKGDEAVDMDDDAPKQETQADRQDGQTQHSNITYVDTQLEVRKASEPSVSYGGKVSESKVEYAAKKPEKAESGRPFHDKLEAKKGEVAKQSPPKPAEAKSKQTSL